MIGRQVPDVVEVVVVLVVVVVVEVDEEGVGDDEVDDVVEVEE